MRVSEEIIQRAMNETSTDPKLRRVFNLVAQYEPHFITWASNRSKEEVQRLIDAMSVPPHGAENVHNALLFSKVLSFFIYHLADQKDWEEDHYITEDGLEAANSIYQSWLDGLLPAPFYPEDSDDETVKKARAKFLERAEYIQEISSKFRTASKQFTIMQKIGISPAVVATDGVPYLLEINQIKRKKKKSSPKE